MSESVYLVVDFGAVCRLCLSSRGYLLTNIFHDEDNSIQFPPVHQQIALLTGIEISREDALPQRICYKCRHLLELSYELRDSAEKTQRLLQEAAPGPSITRENFLRGEKTEFFPKETLNNLIDEELQNETVLSTKQTNLNYNEILDENELSNCNKKAYEEDEETCKDTYLDNEYRIHDNTEDYNNDDDFNENDNNENLREDNEVYNDKIKDMHDINEKACEFSMEINELSIKKEVDLNVKLEKLDDSIYSSEILPKTKRKNSSRGQYESKHERTKFPCELCLIKFTTKENLNLHVPDHYTDSELTPYVKLERPYYCERCCEKMRNRKQLVDHHLQHLNLNPYICRVDGCSFVGKSKEAFRHHTYKHAPPRLVCETCGAAFRRAFELKLHRIRHQDRGATFPCRLCSVVSSNRVAYRAHVRTHERAKRYKCEKLGCPKAFLHRSELVAHTRAHNNDRAYGCHLCVATYTSRSLLTRHVRQHQQRRRITKCDKCCATFDNYTAFCNHRIGVHGAWQPYKCVGCNQGYQSEGRLQKHTARCKLAQQVHSLLNTRDNSLELDLKQQDCESAQGLLCSEESMDTFDSLLLRNLKSGTDEVEHRAGDKNDAGVPGLPPDRLLYSEVDDPLGMTAYPSPTHQDTV